MDETERTKQDTSQEGDTSGGSSGSTSPRTFTEAQVQKAVSDALAKAGRAAKNFEAKEKAIKDAQAAIDERNRQQEEAEAERLKEDPEGLRTLRAKQENKKERESLKADRESLEAEKASHAERLARADELELEVAVWKAAQAKGIDPATLKEKALRFKVTSEEDITDLAETLSSGMKTKTEGTHYDSGKGSGGGGVPSDESARGLISSGLKEREKK